MHALVLTVDVTSHTGLSKCAAFRGGQRDVAVDERMAVSLAIQGAGVDDILRLAYPTLLAIHDPSRGLSGAHPHSFSLQLLSVILVCIVSKIHPPPLPAACPPSHHHHRHQSHLKSPTSAAARNQQLLLPAQNDL